MATLPTFEQLGERPTPQPSLGTASYQTRPANIAGPLTQAGSEMDQAAKVIDFTNRRQAAINAQGDGNDYHQAAQDLKDGPNGFGSVKGGNAVGNEFITDNMARLQEKRAAMEQGISDPIQKAMFKKHADIVDLQYRGALLSHQAKETDSFNDKTESDTVDITRRDMFQNMDNPLAWTAGLTKIDATIAQKGQRMGWPAQTIADTQGQYKERIFSDAGTIMVERDPSSALQLLDKRLGGLGRASENTGNTIIDGLPPAKLAELHSRAFSRVKQQDNANMAANEKVLAEAKKTRDEVREFALTGQMPSPQYESEVRAKTLGTPYEAETDGMLKGSLVGAMHGTQTLPQQQEALRNADALAARDGSSPEALKLLNNARTITNNQAAAYKEDAWDASARFGRQNAVPEAQITSAGQLSDIITQRAPLIGAVEVYAGRPVSPLHPHEAEVLADKLNALPPDQRGDVLASAGSRLNAGQIGALADQLDKKDKSLALALKTGSDMTTAGRTVSALILNGSQALADKTVKKDDAALSGWRSEIAGLVRGTLGDDKAEDDAINAAYYVRAAMENKSGAFEDPSNKGAVSMVIGLPVERNGVKTVLPRGISESDFNSKLRAFTPDRLKELAPSGIVYVRGQPRPVDALYSSLTSIGMKRDGQGKYIPVSGNALVTIDAAGLQPLRLEVR